MPRLINKMDHVWYGDFPAINLIYFEANPHVGMDQYLLIPFLVGWTSRTTSYDLGFTRYQGFDPSPCLLLQQNHLWLSLIPPDSQWFSLIGPDGRAHDAGAHLRWGACTGACTETDETNTTWFINIHPNQYGILINIYNMYMYIYNIYIYMCTSGGFLKWRIHKSPCLFQY